MLTEKGPKVIEYNCRFGDPETQVVLPLLESDLLTIMEATAKGTLSETPVQFSDKSACCLVLASQGTPSPMRQGIPSPFPRTGCPGLCGRCQAGGGRAQDLWRAGPGGYCVGDTLQEAIDKAYRRGPR